MAIKDKSQATSATPKDPKPKVQPKATAAQPKQCLCGCGGPTKGRFRPGHDARLKGILTRIEAEEERDDDRVSEEALAYARAGKPTAKVVAHYTGKDVIRLATQAEAKPLRRGSERQLRERGLILAGLGCGPLHYQ